jgi:hypothetical protein
MSSTSSTPVTTKQSLYKGNTSWYQGSWTGDYWELTVGYQGWHIWYGGSHYTVGDSVSNRLPKTIAVICFG